MIVFDCKRCRWTRTEPFDLMAEHLPEHDGICASCKAKAVTPPPPPPGPGPRLLCVACGDITKTGKHRHWLCRLRVWLGGTP